MRNYGIFEGSILITAQPMSEEDKRTLTAEQCADLEKFGGFLVGVQVRGQVDSRGLGRALGSAVQSYIGELARELKVEPAKVHAEVLPIIVGAMLHYAGAGISVYAGKIQ